MPELRLLVTRTALFGREQEFAVTASGDCAKRSDIPNHLQPPKIGRRIGCAPGHRVEILVGTVRNATEAQRAVFQRFVKRYLPPLSATVWSAAFPTTLSK